MPIQNRNPSPGKKQMTSPEREAAIARFWDKYIGIIHMKGIKESFDYWFVIRARQYSEAFPDKRLALHTMDDLTGYLDMLGSANWGQFSYRDIRSLSITTSTKPAPFPPTRVLLQG
jgi:hypothetical protein